VAPPAPDPTSADAETLRVALSQVNLVVGDLPGNAERMVAEVARAEEADAHLVVFPELAVTGYPPEDLVLKAGFVDDNHEALERIAAATGRCAAVVGYVDRRDGDLHNAAAVCAGGRVIGVYRKHRLPNYSVFDEERYFEPGTETPLFEVGGIPIGVTVCEDAWHESGPIPAIAAGGARLILNINGSPFRIGKVAERESLIGGLAAAGDVPIVYLNLVGGQDELVFDGASFVTDAAGQVVHRCDQFRTDIDIVDVPLGPERDVTLPVTAVTGPRGLDAGGRPPHPNPQHPLDRLDEIWGALVLGTHDYVTKNGFQEIVVGLSGGIDSALVAAVATDALGPENVHVVLMPSRYSSDHSVADAQKLATNLGVDQRIIPIEPAHAAFLDMLAPSFEGTDEGLTEENLQSRIRGVTLMALSNKLGWMVLTTGNKSETSVGYSTLYGDTAGGFAVIKDVPKLLVYELCGHRNERTGAEIIPTGIITKPPSAELRPDQRDDQSLPPYEVLDPILEAYVEGDRTADQLVADGHDGETVARIVRLVDLAEYKRRQSPPGPRITSKAFGKDRRLPITNRYR
jgi:NAD+ synthase (glutamine-hydrolysing)